jgi:predicted  nucleic acid-binding Zn-ribbon protein
MNMADMEKKRKAIIKELKKRQAELARLKKDYQELKKIYPEIRIESLEDSISKNDTEE